jgi:hypothetical protein
MIQTAAFQIRQQEWIQLQGTFQVGRGGIITQAFSFRSRASAQDEGRLSGDAHRKWTEVFLRIQGFVCGRPSPAI